MDVGAAYSTFPLHLAREMGCAVTVVDDFGLNSDTPFWTRGRDPHEYIDANPDVTFALERLGNPAESKLEEESFDVIYSASALEHVPDDLMPAV